MRRILVVGQFRHAQHEPAFCRALRELGHDVCEFSTTPALSGLGGRVQERFVAGPAVTALNRALVAAAREAKPDVVVCYRALPVRPETLRALRRSTGARLVSYQNDDVFGALSKKAYFRLFKQAIPEHDLHLVYRPDELELYRAAGAKRAIVLRSHYLPWVHHPRPAEELAGLACDIGFFGHCEPDRRLGELDALMRRVRARYSVRGSLWVKYAAGRAWAGLDTREVSGDDYARAICAASVALCFLSRWNRDGYTRRVFEIPACGTLLLGQRTDEMLELYEEGREAVFYSGVDELVEAAGRLLADAPLRRRIAEAGFKRCTASGYSVHARMREWLAALEQG